MAVTDDDAHVRHEVEAAVRELLYQQGEPATLSVDDIRVEGGIEADVVERVMGQLERRKDIMCKRVGSDPLAWKLRT
jgi:DNA-binding IscR family transcriptional regulator